jgi:hypothetical protein
VTAEIDQSTHVGEVGIEITPIVVAASPESTFAAQLDALLRRTCQIARALTGAEQAALKLWVGEDPSQARKYFSLSEKYAAYRDFRFDPKGLGLHGMAIPPGEVVRLTEPRCCRTRSTSASARSRARTRRCADGWPRVSAATTVASTVCCS